LQFGSSRLRQRLEGLPRCTRRDSDAFLEALILHTKSHAGLFWAFSGDGGSLAAADSGLILKDVVVNEIGADGLVSRRDSTMYVAGFATR
jgi:hypothetical protein